MANSGVNVNAGFLDGVNTSMGILDAIDGREQRKVQQARQAVLDNRADSEYEYNKQRRGVLTAREDDEYEHNKGRRGVLEAQQDQGHASTMASQSLNRKATTQSMEQSAAMLPLERQMKEAQLSKAYSDVELGKMQVQHAKQAESAKAVQNGVSELMVHLEAGHTQKANQVAKSLKYLGFDTDAIMEGGTVERGRQTVRALIDGKLPMDSEDASWLAGQVLTPALVASGRNPAELKVKGLQMVQRPGEPRFNVMLENAAGDIVPATLNSSSDDKDVTTEITMEELMTGAQGWLGAANAIEYAAESDLQQAGRALQAKHGVLPKPKDQSQDPALMNAQLKRDQYNREIEQEPSENFVASYEDGSPMQSVARVLVDQQGYDPVKTPQQVSEIERLADEEGTDVQMATQLYLRKQETNQLLQSETQNFVQQHGIDGEEAMSIVKKIQSGRYTYAEALKRVDTVKKAAAKSKAKDDKKEKLKKRFSENTFIGLTKPKQEEASVLDLAN